MSIIGTDISTNTPIQISGIERRSGLYVLGKPGMGKSTLLVNLIRQDIERGRSVFFLDPHGDAIQDVLKCPSVVAEMNQDNNVRVLNPADPDYSFGINPLYCENVSNRTDRMGAYNKTFAIFKRLWEQDNQWGIWLQLILENTLPVLIETGYTLAEMPLFLNNRQFREFLLNQVKYNTSPLDFWKYEFKQEQAQPALVRVRSLLGNEYVRDIIGQKEPTVDFPAYAKWGFAVFLHLETTLDPEARRFIGTIFLTELFHTLYKRPEEVRQCNFCLYVDEFQQFATDQFADFILEGRKFGVATTIAHQERLGQFGENQKILGATLACANKVLFQTTVKDARELAPEFAEQPKATQTRMIPELVLSQYPVFHLLRGHPNPQINQFVQRNFACLIRPLNILEYALRANG